MTGAAPAAPAQTRSQRRAQARRADWRGRLRILTLGLLAVWVAAVLAHLAHLDVLILLAVIVGTGRALRTAGSALDRVVLALAVLAGVTCAGSLVLSVWPWHLNPLVLGGAAASVLVALGTLADRGPVRRARLRRADLAVLVPGGVLAVLFTWPTLGEALPVRLGTVFRGEDLGRHFAMFDTIRRVGGYVFVNRAAARSSVAPSDMAYPQGAHLLAVVLDNFLTSSWRVGGSVSSMSHFLYYNQLNYVFLALAVLWSARRLAGPSTGALAFLPVAGLGVAYLLFGSLITMYTYGFFPEIAGLAFLALLTGVLVRPLPDTREQILVVVSLVVAVSYCYYILLPVAAVAVIGYGVVYRRRLRRRFRFLSVAVALGAAACAVPRAEADGEQSLSLHVLLQDFGVVRVHRGAVLFLALLVVFAGAATRSWWRAPAMRVMAVAGGGAVALTAGVGGYEAAEVGRTLYFFEKSLHTVIVLLLIAAGTAAGLVQRLLDGLARRTPAALAACAVTLGLLPAAALGGLDWDPQQLVGAEFHDPASGTSPGRLLVGGQLPETAPAGTALAVADAIPDPAGKITLVSTGRQVDNLTSWYVWMLQRDYGRAWPVYPATFTTRTPEDYLLMIINDPRHQFRVVTSDQMVIDALRQLADQRPDLGLEVDDLRHLPNR